MIIRKFLNLRPVVAACTLDEGVVIEHFKTLHKDWGLAVLVQQSPILGALHADSIGWPEIYPTNNS